MRSALPDEQSQSHEVRFLPGAVVSGFFASVLSVVDSDTMRHVDGGVLKNPVTRASQSGGGGRIPRAGRLKQVWVSAKRRHGSEGQASSTERNWCCDTVRLCFAQTFTKGQYADN